MKEDNMPSSIEQMSSESSDNDQLKENLTLTERIQQHVQNYNFDIDSLSNSTENQAIIDRLNNIRDVLNGYDLDNGVLHNIDDDLSNQRDLLNDIRAEIEEAKNPLRKN